MTPKEQIYGLSHSALAQTLARQIMREARTEHQRSIIIEAWKDLLVYLKAQNVVADSNHV